MFLFGFKLREEREIGVLANSMKEKEDRHRPEITL